MLTLRLLIGRFEMKLRPIAHDSGWLPPDARPAGQRPGMRPRPPRRVPSPVAAGCLAKLPWAGHQPRAPDHERSTFMTAAALLVLLGRADEKISYEQLRTWIVAQAVRNALQRFHGRRALDPDNPDAAEGFISDGQMRALNITIRRTVHEALSHADMARNVAVQPRHRELPATEREALDFCAFQLGTVHQYMEPPGSPELEEAYQRYAGEPEAGC